MLIIDKTIYKSNHLADIIIELSIKINVLPIIGHVVRSYIWVFNNQYKLSPVAF